MKISNLLFNREKNKQKQIEEELIFSLRSFGTQLGAGLSFEECLAKERVFSGVLRSIELGASIPEALADFAGKHDSIFVKKSAALLADIYSKGGDSSSLKKLSDEQAAARHLKAKEYNEKLVMFSLMFIACAAIVPALFLAFVTIGSSFMPLQISPEIAFIAPVCIFPLLNVGAFLFIASKRP